MTDEKQVIVKKHAHILIAWHVPIFQIPVTTQPLSMVAPCVFFTFYGSICKKILCLISGNKHGKYANYKG